MTAELPRSSEATVTVSRAELLGPVLGRVVGMLAARAQCPIDRLDDALLLTDAVAAHAPGLAGNGSVTVKVQTDRKGLLLLVGPLPGDAAQALVAAATLPGVGNVFERVADEVRPLASDLRLHLTFRP